MRKKIIITGATGRIGRALVSHELSQPYEIHAIVRRKSDPIGTISVDTNITCHEVADLASCDINALTPIFQNAGAVIHLAALIAEDGPVNDSATVKMAENVAAACAEAGVPNVILLSSIYARLAEERAANARLYGHRKLAAEYAFSHRQANNTSTVTLRPPAVYGYGMGGSLSAMISLVRSGIPLPFVLANELRDYISINNLSDLIWRITEEQISGASKSGWRVYEPCDGQPLATNELARLIAKSLGRKAVLFPVPTILITYILKSLGKSELADGAFGHLEACGNLELNRDFGWSPAESMPESLAFIRSSAKSG